MSEPNPQVRALAKEAAAKIKALTVAHQTQIETIYTDFRAKAKAAKANPSNKGEEL
jgi:hypothetical protein